jgi:hypothetical protein
MNYLFAFLIAFVAGWSIAACDSLFRAEERPGLFRGSVGMMFLLAAAAAGGLLAAGGAVWAFKSIPSSAVMIVLAGGGVLGAALSNRLHVNAAGAANRMVVGLAGLVILYGVAWSVFPPR